MVAAAISACEKGGRWEEAIQLLREMEGMNIASNTITYNAAISACGKGGRWEEAIQLLREMEGKNIAPDNITYNSLVELLIAAKQIELCDMIFVESATKGLWQDSIIWDKKTTILKVDLHELSVVISKALLRHIVKTIEVRKVMVITGRGNHVLEDGRRGVLKEEILMFVKSVLNLDIETVKGNDGCFIMNIPEVKSSRIEWENEKGGKWS